MEDRPGGETRVLVVDDQPGVTRILRSMLQHDGYEVEEWSSAVGVVERIVAAPPDLVLLDVHMPGRGGLEVLAEVRERLGDQVPVIMLSGETEDISVAVGALKQGALEYLVKPVAMERLLSAVRGALRLAALQREQRRLAEELARARAALDSAMSEAAALWRLSLDPLARVGRDGRLEALNPAAELQLKLDSRRAVGRRAEDVLPEGSLPRPDAIDAPDLAGEGCVPLPDGSLLVRMAGPGPRRAATSPRRARPRRGR